MRTPNASSILCFQVELEFRIEFLFYAGRNIEEPGNNLLSKEAQQQQQQQQT